jgi:hypothetical protein
MSTRERAPLGFSDELDNFDPAAWTPPNVEDAKPKPAEAKRAAEEAAEAAGFRSREPAKKAEVTPPRKEQRRRRTGRNVQFNIKTRQETIDAFLAVVDSKGWGIGETFEYATELLVRDTGAGMRKR